MQSAAAGRRSRLEKQKQLAARGRQFRREDRRQVAAMPGTDLFKGTFAVIEASDEKEREELLQIARRAGADEISFAGNTLELVLIALKGDRPLIMVENKENVLDLAGALKYITEHARYATIAAIADDWAGESRNALMGSVDVFAVRPVTERGIMPGIMVDAARKKRMMELEHELSTSEADFAKKKSMSFAEHIIMDSLGLSDEGAGEYIASLAAKHGYDKNDVAKIVYEVLL